MMRSPRIWARRRYSPHIRRNCFEGDGHCTLIIEDESGRIPVHKIVNGSAYNQQNRDLW